MFWGVTLDSGKRYTQTVEKSFHLSMAALGFQNCSSMPVTVMVEVDKAQFALCTLQPGKIPQQPLDYCFTEGEEITFFMEGPGDVHLTGYLMDEPNALEFEEDEDELSADSEESETVSDASGSESEDEDGSSGDEITLGHLLQSAEIANDDEDDDEESGDDDWDPSKDNPKRKKGCQKEKKKKNSKKDVTEECNGETTGKGSKKKIKETQQSLNLMSNMLSDDDDNEDDDESWSLEEKVEPDSKTKKKEGNKKKEKKNKHEKETVENGAMPAEKPKKKAKKKVHDRDNAAKMAESVNTLDNNKEGSDKLSSPSNTLNALPKTYSKKEHEKTQKQEDQQQGSPAKKNNQSQAIETKKRKLPGGIVVEDLKKGEGQAAKKGQTVYVYYKGNLAKNKKQFDACLSGPPFSFKLGSGEVIRGWDLGVAGMQVGGKRRLTVPPSQGYGNQKIGPIPPNSTLEFEIQLIRLQ